MTRAGWLWMLICLPSWVNADGGAMLLEHELTFNKVQPTATDYRVDGMYTLHETLHNNTSKDWAGLRVELVHPVGQEWLPATAHEGVSFMASEPTAAWRPSVEARIDGNYLGIAGGGWTLHRNADATVLEMRFEENLVVSGATLQLRLRVINMHDTTWRLRYMPIPAADSAGTPSTLFSRSEPTCSYLPC
jgi:hypothetical protein